MMLYKQDINALINDLIFKNYFGQISNRKINVIVYALE